MHIFQTSGPLRSHFDPKVFTSSPYTDDTMPIHIRGEAVVVPPPIAKRPVVAWHRAAPQQVEATSVKRTGLTGGIINVVQPPATKKNELGYHKLYFTSLPWTITKDQLRRHISQSGGVDVHDEDVLVSFAISQQP